MLFFCTFVAFMIIRCAVGRSPQNEAFTNEVDALSDLQMLMPIEVIKHPKKSKSALYYEVGNPGKLGLMADGPYSRIPDEEFLLEDSDGSPKKTTKKDLGSAKPYKKAYEQASKNHPKPSAYEKLPTEFAHRCLEYMHQYKFVTLGKAGHENQQGKSDHELMVGLCRKYLENTYKPRSNAKVTDGAQNAAGIVSFVGSGGYPRNLGVDGKGAVGNTEVNGQGGYAGSLGISGLGKQAGTVGIGGYVDSNVPVNALTGLNKIFNGLGIENMGLNEHDGHASDVAYIGQESGAGNVGKGGDLGNVGVGGKGGQYGNFLIYILSGLQAPRFRVTTQNPIAKYMSLSHVSGHHGNGKSESSGNSGHKAVPFALMNDLQQLKIFEKLATNTEAQEVKETAPVLGQEAANVQNVERYNSKSHTEDEAGVDNLISKNRGGQALTYEVGSLGGSIDNHDVSFEHKQTGEGCGHLECVNVYVLDVNSLGGSKRAGTLQPSPQTLGKLPMPSSSPVGVPSKFRPIGGRRGWMVLDDPTGKKPWLIL